MNKATSLYLDVVRFAAAWLVFLQHAKEATRDSLRWFWLEHSDLYSLMNVLSQTAVTVFFVLSGYVIAHVLSTRERTPLEFAASRVGRLYSVMIPALVLTVLCNHMIAVRTLLTIDPLGDPGNYALRLLGNLALVNSFWLWQDLSIQNAPFWSLSFEAVYYLAIALIFFARGYLRIIALTGLALLSGPSMIALAPTWFAGYWLYGISLRYQLRTAPAFVLWFSGAAIVLLSCWIELHLRYSLPWLRTPDHNLGYVIAAYAAALGFSLNVFAVRNLDGPTASLLERFAPSIRWLASLTFALYLFHSPLLSVFMAYGVSKLSGALQFAILVGGTFAIVCTLGRLCESSKFAYRRVFLAAFGFIALPLRRGFRLVRGESQRLKNALGRSRLALAILPASREDKLNAVRLRRMCAAASGVLAQDPKSAAAWRSLGQGLAGLNRFKEAIRAYDSALMLVPDHSNTWQRRAAAMRALGREVAPPECAVNPRDANSWAVLAGYLVASMRLREGVEASGRALELDPDHIAAARLGIHARHISCDWSKYEDDKRRISAGVRAGQRIIGPYFHRSRCDSESEALILARFWASQHARPARALWNGEIYRHGKIRVAYMSSDFRDHLVADAIAGCFEHHDKSLVETTAISLSPNDGSMMRLRIEGAVDRFIEVRAMSDVQVATMLRELEIDILVDLNGYTAQSRTGILVFRPAPVQVNYLGYPGTMGAPCLDYIIADHMLIPEEARAFYTERVVYLPHTYMPVDSKRRIPDRLVSRTEAGLPSTGFVFGCFNPSHKLGPDMFEIWMSLLRAVDGSVLWLRANTESVENLRREAIARGVVPDRLVFAPTVPSDDHLARLPLVDILLDTLPFNAHTTACDALRMGVPVLTCLGGTFSGRVAGSLLCAIGLPELVTSSLSEYGELALALARDPERLRAIKAKLVRNRDIEPLFDTARFTGNLETAYSMMWERSQECKPPESFSVPEGSRTPPYY